MAAAVRASPAATGRRKVFTEEAEEEESVAARGGDVFTAEEIRDLYSLSKPVVVPVVAATPRNIGPQLPKVSPSFFVTVLRAKSG